MPKSKYKIRAARAEECDRLTEIARQAKAYWGYPDTLMGLWEEELTVLPEYLQRHAVYCAVDKSDNIVGLYALSGDGPVMELDHMWVVPAMIGNGIGELLFEHIIATATSKSAKKIQILSDPNAEGFYTRMGARKIGSMESKPPTRKLPLMEYRLDGADR